MAGCISAQTRERVLPRISDLPIHVKALLAPLLHFISYDTVLKVLPGRYVQVDGSVPSMKAPPTSAAVTPHLLRALYHSLQESSLMSKVSVPRFLLC